MTAPIFITGRFRSGSSFFWNMFQQMSGHCAWYEPLNPQLLAHVQYTEPKADHVNVSDYWASYRQNPAFAQHFDPGFAHEHLWLGADEKHPPLKAYIQHLVTLSGADRPVLQFNRMDFRLAWLKANFPEATIVSVRRNPWWLYRSQRKHIEPEWRDDPDHMDAYELAQWCWALSEAFPFLINELNQHAFERCYALLQLSNAVADENADVVIDLERDVFDSDDYLELLLEQQLIDAARIPEIKAIQIKKQQPDFEAADKASMSGQMTRVDLVIQNSGALSGGRLKPVSQTNALKQQVLQDWLRLMNQQQSEQTRLLHMVRQLEHVNQALKQQIDEQSETD